MTSWKYRRRSLPEIEKNNILRKINNFTKEWKPIKITPCFWWYKQSWILNFPWIWWSEIFHISYFIKYVSFISRIYKPWVIIEWESEDIILEVANNFKKADLDTYSFEFKKILEIFLNSKNIPDNLYLKYVRAREQYSSDLLIKNINLIKDEKVKEIKELELSDFNLSIARVSRNFVFNWKKDFSDLNNDEKLNKIIESKALNLSFLDVDYELREKYFEEDIIPVVFSFWIDKENAGEWLTLSSNSSSFCDFWAWNWILEVRDNWRIIDRILSKKQYLKIKNDLHTLELNTFSKKDSIIPSSIEIYFGTINI